MRNVTIAITQMTCTWNRDENIHNAMDLVKQAASQGAQIIVLQELFATPYFCIDKDKKFFKEATPFDRRHLLSNSHAPRHHCRPCSHARAN